MSRRPATGIVHLGLGAFARAFVCPFVADAMAASGGDWGITGVSLRSSDTRDALRGQGWAYHAVSLTPNGPSPRRISTLNDVLFAPENPQAVLAALSDPHVRLVTLTVTEKGYCVDPATGGLDAAHPDIRHDLTHPVPVSAPGYLVRALQVRRDAGLRPFTAVSCDNLANNGALLRGAVLDLARRIDPALADWIAAETRFPATMVDRITPATTDADIAMVARLTGYRDAAPVMHEPFAQWAIVDDFVDGARPDLAAAGAELVADVGPHERMKLRMLNGAHSALAYLGYLAGHDTIADAMVDPVLNAYARLLWSEIAPTVAAPPGVSLDAYAARLCDRFANPAIRHRTWQIAMDGSQKLPPRLLGTIRDRLDRGQDSPVLCHAVAAWMRYARGVDERGRLIDLRDPMAGRLRALAIDDPDATVTALLSLREVFPADLAARLHTPLTEAARRIWRDGARASTASL